MSVVNRVTMVTPLLGTAQVSDTAAIFNRRLVSSVDRASVCCAGGRGFEP